MSIYTILSIAVTCTALVQATQDACNITGNLEKASQYPWAAPRTDDPFCSAFARFRAQRAADQLNASLAGVTMLYGDSVLAIYSDSKPEQRPQGIPAPSRYWAIGGWTALG